MKMTFRWFGKDHDSVPLRYIRQIPGATGIMGVLADKDAGEVWEADECKSYTDYVHDHGLEAEVIESVNIHEDIKTGVPSRDRYIENYITTIRNLAACGVKVIIYNFMPVFDWLRTDLDHILEEDGSRSMFYDEKEIEGLTPVDIVKNMMHQSNGFSLPGWEPERLSELERTLEIYKSISPDDLRANLKYFFDAVIPVCEETGVRLACHPDDPAWPIFGLPRILHSLDDCEKLLALHDSPANTICLCTGSLGSDPENDIPAIIRALGTRNRIGALHIRNIRFLGNRVFRESAHPTECGDLDMYEIMKAVCETCPEDIHVRPDHGRMVFDESGRPGYGLYDRAIGAAYLEGLYEAIKRA